MTIPEQAVEAAGKAAFDFFRLRPLATMKDFEKLAVAVLAAALPSLVGVERAERRLLLAIAMMLLNPDKGRAELEAAAKALLADKRDTP